MPMRAALQTPTDQAFALAAFHAENNPWCALDRAGAGYLAQEAERLRS